MAFAALSAQIDAGWTLDVRAGYATGPNLAVAVLLALTGYCARVATGGRVFGTKAGRDD